MNHIACIFCNTLDNPVVIEQNGFQGRQCLQCQLIYISPRPDLEEIKNLYGHDQAQVSASTHISGSVSKRLHARHTLKRIRIYKKEGNLLEIGAGAGFFVEQARKVGFDPIALELNPIQADFIRTHLGIVCHQSLLELNLFGSTRFDVIYHCDVISHLYDPIAAFEIMHKLLKPQGLLVFETGNLAEVDKKYFRHIPSFQYPDHLFFFSQKNIRTLLDATGFKLLKVHSYSLMPYLKLGKIVRQIKKRIKTQKGHNTPSTLALSHKRVSTQEVVRSLYHYVNHHVRYSIGSVGVRAELPQTVIYIAQRV